MRRGRFTQLLSAPMLLAAPSPVLAETATMDEALRVANNWISLIVHKRGDWGGFETAEVTKIQEFMREARVLGYFCDVKPQGFVVISLRKDLATVKAFSATSNLDPASNEGMVDVIKSGMERALTVRERKLDGTRTPRPQDGRAPQKPDHARSWQVLGGEVRGFRDTLSSGEAALARTEVGPLVDSLWHQDPPYNDQCPERGCTNSPPYNTNALVGCVATAGAQIMRYWAWPPYGEGSPYGDRYDWSNMLDEYFWDAVNSRFTNDAGDPCTQVQIDAVAELCREAGRAAGMGYGCEESSASVGGVPGADMLDAFENKFRYHDNADFEWYVWHTSSGWFEIIKRDINKNRLLQYAMQTSWLIGGHSMVVDGWAETWSGNVLLSRQYHVNYGWGGSDTAWYTLDELPYEQGAEMLIRALRPAPALGTWLSGTYARTSFAYRYFDQDAAGGTATFDPGQSLQFLPGVTVTGGTIRFLGSSSENSRLFTRGDEAKGAVIRDGTIRLNSGGSIVFPK